MTGRAPLRSLALVAGTIVAGLVLRLVRLGRPDAMVKGSGSLLWATMVYWIVSALRPRWRPVQAATWAMVVATAVGLFKLVGTPEVDRFRATLAGGGAPAQFGVLGVGPPRLCARDRAGGGDRPGDAAVTRPALVPRWVA